MTISKTDKEYLKVIRRNVTAIIKKAADLYDSRTIKVLDIAPAQYDGAAKWFTKAQVETVDIDYKANATYTADITKNNQNFMYSGTYSVVICTEVLEHTKNPFAAVAEIYRLLRVGGIAVVTTPFNFRIHGPAPDCWRFTRQGLEVLFSEFEILELTETASERELCPIHYQLIAKKI